MTGDQRAAASGQPARDRTDAPESGSPTDWFDELYAAAGAGTAVVPWERGAPHPLLVEWLAHHPTEADGKRAIVAGCGRGNDAELIAARGFDTVAFDVSPAAVEQARDRYPESVVDYRVADLLDLPGQWRQGFDLVVESLTVQSLPPKLHERAASEIASLVGVGGLLVVIASMATEPATMSGEHSSVPQRRGPPWPLTADEIGYFATGGVERSTIETVPGSEGSARWRAEFRRPDPERDRDKTLQHWL